MSSHPSSSQASARNTHEPPPPANTRYLIHVAADGTVGGREADKWSSRCCALIRAHIPIHYTDWRLIPKNFKDGVWTALMAKEKELKKLKAKEKAEKLQSQQSSTAPKRSERKNAKRDAGDENTKDYIDPETRLGEKKLLSRQLAKQYNPSAVEKS